MAAADLLTQLYTVYILAPVTPKTRFVKVLLGLPPELLEGINAHACARGISRSEAVRNALAHFLATQPTAPESRPAA